MQYLDQFDARHAVDHGVVQLEEDDGASAGVAVEDGQVPQRAVALEEPAVQLTAHPGQHPIVSWGGERLLVDVVGDLEVGVVFPGGMGDAERRRHDLLAVPRQEVHAVADHPDHVGGGDVAVVDHALGDVHGLFRAFPAEEHRVVGRQSPGG